MDDTETNPADAPRTPEPARGESDNTARLRPEGLQPEAAAQQQPAAAAAQQPAASAQPPAGTAYPYGAPQAPGANGGWQRPARVPPYGWHPGQAPGGPRPRGGAAPPPRVPRRTAAPPAGRPTGVRPARPRAGPATRTTPSTPRDSSPPRRGSRGAAPRKASPAMTRRCRRGP